MAPGFPVADQGRGYVGGVHLTAEHHNDVAEGLRVLVVDDNAGVRSLVRLGLELDDRFTEVTEATNGREAIEAAESDPPDVILLDQTMPVMTGLEALPALRETVPMARIVVFSAVSDEIDLRDVADADACVPKDVDLFELYSLLAEPHVVTTR